MLATRPARPAERPHERVGGHGQTAGRPEIVVLHVSECASRAPVGGDTPVGFPSVANGPVTVVEVGTTEADDGTYYPTVVLDVTGRPEVADLARVHAVEGVGDLSTSASIVHDTLLLQVRMTSPVRAEFTVPLHCVEHRLLLEDIAQAGCLLLATPARTSPEFGIESESLWLAVNVDGDALMALLGP